MEKFINTLKELITNHFSGMYLPALSQRQKFAMIILNMLRAAYIADITIHKFQILEIADNEFAIRVNHDLFINFTMCQEGKEVAHG